LVVMVHPDSMNDIHTETSSITITRKRTGIADSTQNSHARSLKERLETFPKFTD
jgi:hypothetical protein